MTALMSEHALADAEVELLLATATPVAMRSWRLAHAARTRVVSGLLAAAVLTYAYDCGRLVLALHGR